MFQMFIGLLAAYLVPNLTLALDFKDIQAGLKSPEGLVAEIHGSDKDNGFFVAVIRDQNNFFDYVQVPLVANYLQPDFKDIQAKLYTLNRHDLVRLKGELHGFIEAAQRHVLVDSIEVLKKFDGGYGDHPDYKHDVELPNDLQGKEAVIVKVHAVGAGGKILVVEYKDTNLPVVVSDPLLVQGLYRGDKIQIQFEIAEHPGRPTHIKLKSGSDALVVLDALVAQHDTPIEHCGPLVMFPKSPMVKFNVFAIKKDIGDDLFRTYTLINFDNMDLFHALREKAQKAWDAGVETAERGRNYFVNTGVTACASGKVNMIDQTQANPQIVITNINNLWFETTAAGGSKN